MKVFLSWSGEQSKQVASALHEWLPLVLHYVEPWVSDLDISAGERWSQEIAAQLEACDFGVICVTRDSLNKPWVLFEAGALAKSMKDSRVVPLLLDLEFSELGGPLAQFQAKKIEQSSIEELIKSINKASDQRVAPDRAQELSTLAWPKLEALITKIPRKSPVKKRPTRSQSDILEELVATVRGLDSRFSNLEQAFKKTRGVAPIKPVNMSAILRRIQAAVDSPDEPTVALELLAHAIAPAMPYAAELLIEAARDLRYAPPARHSLVLRRLDAALRHEEMSNTESDVEASYLNAELRAACRKLASDSKAAMRRRKTPERREVEHQHLGDTARDPE